MPYLNASAVVIHYEEALYQVYAPLPLPLPLPLITYAKFGEDRLSGFGVARGQISGFPVYLRSRSSQHTRIAVRECKPGGYFSNPGLRVDGIQTRVPGFDIWWVTCQWQTRNSQIVYYKQLRGGQMEVWLDTQTIRDEAYYRNVS